MLKALKFVVYGSLIFLISGCNQSGMSSKTLGEVINENSDVAAFMQQQNYNVNPEMTVGEFLDTPLGQSEEVTTFIATVRNPEPATMLLWGIGLAGAALSRRRKKNRI